MNTNARPLNGQRIGFFGKGGSGKSTAVALLTKALADFGYQVCVIDADSTNVGLAQALAFKDAPRPLVDYFGGMVFSGGSVTCPVDDPSPLPRAEVQLKHLPGEYYARSENGVTLLLTGKMGELGPGAGCDGPIAKIARDFRLILPEPAVTLLDFKAGFEDIARGVMTSLDWVVVVVDPTVASLELAKNMNRLIRGMKAGALPATQHLSPEMVAVANAHYRQTRLKGVVFVLNKVADGRMQDFMREQLEKHEIRPVAVFHEEAVITECWLEGSPIFAARLVAEASHVIHALESLADIGIRNGGIEERAADVPNTGRGA